jgi:hypothetical protein
MLYACVRLRVYRYLTANGSCRCSVLCMLWFVHVELAPFCLHLVDVQDVLDLQNA